MALYQENTQDDSSPDPVDIENWIKIEIKAEEEDDTDLPSTWDPFPGARMTQLCQANVENVQTSNSAGDKNKEEPLIANECEFEIHPLLQCSFPTCDKIFTSQESLDKHHRTVHPATLLPCYFCDATIKSSQQLMYHMWSHHTVERPYSCKVKGCRAGFCASYQRNRHFNANHTKTKKRKRFLCDQCPKEYLSAETLKNHVEFVHTISKRFECLVCKKLFPRKAYLEDHTRVSHTGEKPFACKFCDYKYGRRNTLSRHVRLKHPKNTTGDK
ncbi:zinc finger protein 519 isoform X2 [Folsomia candida]|uniref:zinc finger protein 519 isoform X2 n=1 Tax=Folsomia candida TaxID=158441 RepID=UPI000B8FF7CE|nr:zinc finger protein 519 isoform X2 [Folsomia candida]